MASKFGGKEKLPQINFTLDEDLAKYLIDLKGYHKISTNNDMVRNAITIAWREMIKEKRDLGLLQQDIFE